MIKKYSLKKFFITAGLMAAFLFFTPYVYSAQPAGSSGATGKTIGGFFEINSSCSKKTATVGEPAECAVNIIGAGAARLNIDQPEKIIYPPEEKKFDLKKNKTGDKNFAEGDAVPLFTISSFEKKDSEEGIILSFTATAFMPGKHTIPLVKITGEDGIAIGYASPEIEISELNPNAELEDIEPPLELKGNYYRLAALILIAALIGALAFFIIKKYLPMLKKTKPVEERPTAIEIFRREIESLAPENLIAEFKIEEYSFGISSAFRRFLSAQFLFDAIEMTSDEINKKMKKVLRNSSGKNGADIARLFELWDLAKFAEFAPSAETLKLNLELAQRAAERLSSEEAHERI